jgi:hypothetical protein
MNLFESCHPGMVGFELTTSGLILDLVIEMENSIL